jgi:hypothetical protein
MPLNRKSITVAKEEALTADVTVNTYSTHLLSIYATGVGHYLVLVRL